MQTRTETLIEAVLNTFIAFWVSYWAGVFLYPMFGFHPTPGQNALIVAIFSVISIARNYLIRRFFNARLKRAINSLVNSESHA